MEVILLTQVDNLGGIGDKVKVHPGYGRNYLIPQGKAVAATAENLAEFEQRRAALEAAASEALATAAARKAALDGKRFEVRARAGEEGKLFGSVGTTDIADAVSAAGFALERREVRLPESGAIRELGEFEIVLHLHSDVDASVTIAVVAEE